MIKKRILGAVAAVSIFGTVGCQSTSQLREATGVANVVSLPVVSSIAAVRGRVATKLTPVLIKRPQLIPWANDFAKVSYSLSGIKLPAPAALQSAFSVTEIFAPSDINTALNSIMSVYTLDYPAASAVDAAAVPYLTLLGEGIQDAVTAAQAPASP